MSPLAAIRTGWSATGLAGVWVAALCALAGCTKARPVDDGTPACTTWKQDIGPAFTDAACAECHGGSLPAAGWSSTTYLGAVGIRTQTEFAVAGDPASRLLAALDPASPIPAHRVAEPLREEVRRWVVDCRLSFAHGSVHAPGILNPKDPDFHGKLVHKLGWDFALCGRCHGEDFSGGKAEVSCTQCHAKGPTDCTTCHSAIAQSGAHGPHLSGAPLQHPLGCPECHLAPHRWNEPGHILNPDGTTIETPVKITFGAAAAQTPAGMTRTGPPTYDPAEKQCSNVYCHGGTLNDARAKDAAPRWTDGTTADSCGGCHGVPPQNHGAIPLQTCPLCHVDLMDTTGHLLQPEKHVDGKVDVRADITSTACTACHGEGDSPAPPRDLHGNTAVSSLGVGAHQSHLKGPHRLTAPVACGDCHLVPANVLSPGHVDADGPARVFPATIAATSKAFNDGAAPQWDRDAGTCSNVYCHGGGTKLARDGSPTLSREPRWTGVGTQQVVCGSCHGAPPVDDKHTPDMKLNGCAACHPSVDGYGNPIITGAPGQETSKHINGVVDVLP